MKQSIIRQGDVILVPVKSLPKNLSAVPLHGGRIVLAFGEVTGHAHAIADHGISEEAAAEVAEAAIARARLWRAEDGSRYLEVREPVSLVHEEHTAHTVPPGIYELPVQMEYNAATMRRVAD